MTPGNLLTKAIGFLRIGYRQDVPVTDTFAVLGLLDRRLSDEEVGLIAVAVARGGTFPVATTDIRVVITRITGRLPAPEEVRRVRTTMASYGWPTYEDCAR